MRLFKIEDQPKEYLFDIDGNVFHPKLRDEIKQGMVVGLRIVDRQIPKISEEKRIENINEYNRLFNQYMKFMKKKNEHQEEIRVEIKKILEKLTIENNQLLEEKQIIENQLKQLKESNIDEPFVVEDFEDYQAKTGILQEALILVGSKQKEVKKRITRLTRDLNVHSFFANYDYLINEYNISRELIETFAKCDDLFCDLEDMMYEYRKQEEQPWKEVIYFKVVKRTKDKLHGDVLDKYRKLDSKCSLKTNDRISFYLKSILFVPSSLNQKAKLQTYYLTNFKYKFYQTDRVTDWSGIFLDKKARDHITPGSIVRIQMKETTKNRKEIWYTYILEKEGEIFTGELLDFYKIDREFYNDPFKIGCIHQFKKECITEIPLMWNEHLPNLKKFINSDNWGYAITGYRSDDNYFGLNKE